MNVALIAPFENLPAEPVRAGRYTCLARELARRGHTVTWLSSTFSHLQKRQRAPADWAGLPGVTLQPVPAASYPRNIHPMRLVSQGQFAVNAARILKSLLNEEPRPSAIVVTSPPLLAAWMVTRVARKHGVPVIVDIQDLWPDAFERFLPPGIMTTGAFFVPRRVRAAAERNADAVVAVSDDYLRHVAHARTAVLHLGHDMAAFDAAHEGSWCRWTRAPGERWVVYVGTVSRNYDLAPAIQAAREFPTDRFFVVGEGEALGALKAQAADLKNVVFTGRLPYPDLANLVSRADAGLVGVNSRARIMFPGKTFDYLAGGLKLLTSRGAGELRDLVVAERLGAVYEEGSASSLAEALRACLAEQSPEERSRIRALARERFASAVIYRKYAAFVEAVAGGAAEGVGEVGARSVA